MSIEWTDLPKRYTLLTKRDTRIVLLGTTEVVRYLSANTRINAVQETYFEGERYFRTEHAVVNGLDWAIKADSFILPTEDASPVPNTRKLTLRNGEEKAAAPIKQKPIQKKEPAKGEELVSSTRRSGISDALKRFFRSRAK